MLLTINKRGNVRTNVTLRHIRVMIVVVEKQSVLIILIVCICSITYPTRKVRVPYCHLWPVWFDRIYLRYLMHGTIFGKKFIELKMCNFDFLYNFFSNIPHSNKK